MLDSVTECNLGLHSKDSAMSFYDGRFELRRDEIEIVRKYFPAPPARVLDLGVGNGRTTVPLHQMHYDVVGLEYCQELVEAGLRQHPGVCLIQGDARNLSYDDRSFDVVWFSWNGIDYMCPFSERQAVLREAYRVLKPGGVFFVSSHNALGVIGRLLKPVGLTLVGLRFLLDQVTFRRPFFSWYCVWKDSALGAPVFYSAPPSRQIRELRHHGFIVEDVSSVVNPERRAVWWRDVHVNYVCRKPGS